MNSVIHGDDNFHKKLYSALCSDNISIDDECLICGDQLKNDYIELECDHTFDYGCIFHEVKKQKGKQKKDCFAHLLFLFALLFGLDGKQAGNQASKAAGR